MRELLSLELLVNENFEVAGGKRACSEAMRYLIIENSAVRSLRWCAFIGKTKEDEGKLTAAAEQKALSL
jgi:hypothetical protein